MTLKKEKKNEITKKRNCEITEQVIRHNLVQRAHVITTEIQREFHSCSDLLKRQIQFEHRWHDEKQRANVRVDIAMKNLGFIFVTHNIFNAQHKGKSGGIYIDPTGIKIYGTGKST